jgi:ABC-type multidrug transport system fused ATPase/permease subunit
MSTIIAGLGVGSLAVALAAQKTLENVIGAITLYSARPVNPGDLCRFGDIVGVVEEIGLRSTLIRTLDRTMLAVPNSVFSSVEVENFSHRDRIRYYRHIELQMTTADQLRVILGRLRELFLSHADVLQETVSIRLEKIVAANAVIRIDAGIDTTDYQRFLAVAEDLNLRMIELVHDAGAPSAVPGRSCSCASSSRHRKERWPKSRRSSALAQRGPLPFPDFTSSEKAALLGAIRLPPRATPPEPEPASAAAAAAARPGAPPAALPLAPDRRGAGARVHRRRHPDPGQGAAGAHRPRLRAAATRAPSARPSAVVLVITTAIAVGTFFRFYLVSWLGERVSADLRSAVFRNLVRLHPGFFEDNRSGEIMSRLTADTTVLQTIIGSSMSMALRSALTLTGASS